MQVLVDRDGDEQDREMALLGPGKLLQVSNVVGRGFSSLFNSYVGLMSSMEESRDLLLLGARFPLLCTNQEGFCQWLIQQTWQA